jgi:putative transposase
MTVARSEIVNVEATPYYHCIARCVRRAFLCGDDSYSGRNFDHRKLWIVERIKLLASLFAIDVCAYAILATHLHVILRIMAERVAGWSEQEVIGRARQLCPTCGDSIDEWPEERRELFVQTWRGRLADISWFMSKLDEYIARKANEEDRCSGRFWEGRFKSKALMDDGALLTAMAYVDLNPIRAGIAKGLDDSSWTSIQQRLREVAASMAQGTAESSSEDRPTESNEGEGAAPLDEQEAVVASEEKSSSQPAQPEPELHQCPALAPMDGDRQGGSDGLPLSLLQYIALLEWTGRVLRDDKRGTITAPPSELLTRCGLDPDRWLESVQRFGSLGGYVGHPSQLRQRASQMGRRWLKGQGYTMVAYSMAA